MQKNNIIGNIPSYLFSIYSIIIVGFCLRFIYSLIFPEMLLSPPTDSYFYNLTANCILNGEGYHELNLYAYRPPLYAFFLSQIYRLFGPFPDCYYAVIFLQTLISVISVYYLYRLSFELFEDRKKAQYASLIFCLFPTFITLNAELLTETLFFGLFIPGFYYAYIGIKFNHAIYSILGAILFGLSSLTREITFYFYPLIIVLYLVTNRSKIKNKIIIATCMLLGFGVTLTPWLIRNYDKFDTVLISTSGGINFYMGNNEDATGFFKWKLPDRAVWAPSLDKTKITLKEIHKTELSTNKKCYNEGINFIKENPMQFVVLSIKRLVFFWLPPFSDLREIQFTAGSLLRIIRFIYTIAITILGLLGIIKAIQKKQYCFYLLIIWVFYTTSFHSIVVVNHRYSLTMIPFLCIFVVELYVNRPKKKLMNLNNVINY